MFLVELPNPTIRIDRVLYAIDNSMPGGHAVVTIDNLRGRFPREETPCE